MSHLIICRGLPGSGKSTWANREVAKDRKNRIRVNRDSLRLMAHDGVFEKGLTEQFIITARNVLIEKFLKQGMTVINDDTNLPKRNVSELIKIANKMGASWEIEDFTDVPLDLCIDRDLNRENSVGISTIADMHNRFLRGKQPLDFRSLNQSAIEMVSYERENLKALFTAYIVDIDGTVALHDRSPYDYSLVSTDRPNYPVIDVVQELASAGHEILFTSGRPESCREDTEKWLKTFVMQQAPYTLIMRATGDTRADWIVKYELFDKHIRPHYDVLGVFDDRDQVVSMWRSIGLTCFQVDYGDF